MPTCTILFQSNTLVYIFFCLMPHVAPYDATARKTDLPTSPPSPLLAMMCGNVAGNVTPRPPPPFVNRRPLPTWYNQLGRTRPLLLNNNTPFLLALLHQHSCYQIHQFTGSLLFQLVVLERALKQRGHIMMKVPKKKSSVLKNNILILNNFNLNNIIIFLRGHKNLF